MRSMLLAIVGVLATSFLSPRLAIPCTPDANTISVSSVSAQGNLINFNVSVYNGQCSGYLSGFTVWVNGKFDGSFQFVVAPKETKPSSYSVKWNELTSAGSINELKLCLGTPESPTACDSKQFVTQVASQCTSGKCCDIASGTFYSSSKVCDSNIIKYICKDGTNPGDDVYVKYGVQYCKGNNQDCTGQKSFSGGKVEVYDNCKSSEQCVDGESSCQPIPSGGCVPSGSCDGSLHTLIDFNCNKSTTQCSVDQDCTPSGCVNKKGCQYSNPPCGTGYSCVNNSCVANAPTCSAGYKCDGPSFYFYQYADCSKGTVFACLSDKTCVNGDCVLKSGCQYSNPPCGTGYSCENNACVASGPTCSAGNKCKDASTVAYQNADCTWSWMTTACAADSSCSNGACVKKGCKPEFQCINESTYKFTYDDCKETTSYCKPGQVCNSTGGPICQCAAGNKCKDGSSLAYQNLDCSWGPITTCTSDKTCSGGACVLKQGCQYNNPKCGDGFSCANNVCVKECKEGFKCLGINTYTFGYKDCSDNGVKTCASGEVCSDVPGENICIKSQCTSGDCCDKDKQKYLPYGTVCGAQAEKEYGCPQGDGAVYVKSQDKVCSGQYHVCYQNSGKWSEWAQVEDCKTPSTCVAGQAKCMPKAAGEGSCKNELILVQKGQEKFCPGGCKGGKCVVTCSSNAECGTNQYFGGSFCTDKNFQSTYKGFNFYTCVNPGKEDSYCKSEVAVRPDKYCMPGLGVCNGGSCNAYCSAGKKLGTQGYCTKECQCRLKEGHCNSDAECRGKLKCVKGVGLKFGFAGDVAVCMEPVSLDEMLEDAAEISGAGVLGKAIKETKGSVILMGDTKLAWFLNVHAVEKMEAMLKMINNPLFNAYEAWHANIEVPILGTTKHELNLHIFPWEGVENGVLKTRFYLWESISGTGKVIEGGSLSEMRAASQQFVETFVKSKYGAEAASVLNKIPWPKVWDNLKLAGFGTFAEAKIFWNFVNEFGSAIVSPWMVKIACMTDQKCVNTPTQ